MSQHNEESSNKAEGAALVAGGTAQSIFQNAKRLIGMCLVTLFLITSTLLSFPAPASAAGDIVVNLKCESECGNMAAFATGVIGGSMVTLAATGSAGSLPVEAVAILAATGSAGSLAVAPLAAVAAPVMAVVAPVLLPVAAIAGVGYIAHRLWKGSK